MKRYLILEDGSYYEGEAFGSDNFRIGEIVFNTSMTGYQETLSDLSYCGQIVVMTYPLIGNYGINRDDFESLNPAIFGFIVKEACKEPNNFRSVNNLDSFSLYGFSLSDDKGAYSVLTTFDLAERNY